MRATHHSSEHPIARRATLTRIPKVGFHSPSDVAFAGAIEAAEAGLIEPVLVGPQAVIAALAAEAEIDLSPYRSVDAAGDRDTAAQAVMLCRRRSARRS
jgi:phosphate acetyltransferase